MKMKTKLLLLLFLLNFVYIAKAQYFKLPELTKEEMYADFDEFVKIIEDCAVQLPVKKAVTGFDYLSEIKKMRENIDTVSNTEGFYILVELSLYLLNDKNSLSFEIYYDSLSDDIDGIDVDFVNQYSDYLREQIFYNPVSSYPPDTDISVAMAATFFDNNYYIIGDNVFPDKDSSKNSLKTHVSKIITINGENFFNCVENEIIKSYSVAKWDFNNKKFFGESVALPLEGILKVEENNKIIEYKIEDYIYKSWTSLLFDMGSTDIPKKSFSEKDNNGNVQYFEKDSILYIYPNISSGDSYIERFIDKIIETGKNKAIKKIIIDFRNIPFATDSQLSNILKSIVKDTLSYKIEFAYNDTELMRKKFKKYDEFSKSRSLKYLDNQKLRVVEKTEQIIPSNNSLKYDGKIYLLSDNKNSSLLSSFIISCNYHDKIVSVGDRANTINGANIETCLFQLNKSKFTFRLSTTIDLTNCRNAEDVWHSKAGITVKPSFEDFLYHQSLYDILTEKYLYNYDTIFRKILEIK